MPDRGACRMGVGKTNRRRHTLPAPTGKMDRLAPVS
jgi:hypothetical protein